MKKEIEKKSETEFCPIRNILDRFGDKWSILVIITLGKNGKMRFNELNSAISDISQKMLTVTLRTLEADGLLTRTIYPQIPPRVEYELTEMGSTLLPLIGNLVDWALKNKIAIKESRAKYEHPNAN